MAHRLTIASGLALLPGLVAAQEMAPPAAERDERAPLLAYPHPLITEVFFSVPGSGGDANGDALS